MTLEKYRLDGINKAEEVTGYREKLFNFWFVCFVCFILFFIYKVFRKTRFQAITGQGTN